MLLLNTALLIAISVAVLYCAMYSKFAVDIKPCAILKNERWLILSILALALIIRLWDFGLVPGGVNQDGAMAAVDAKALADYASDRFGMRLPVHLTAWGYGQMSAMLSYLIAPLVKVFGLNVYTLRLPLLIFSMLGMLCFFLFMREGFGSNAGLISLALTAVSPWHFMQSRWALDCNLFPHFFVIGIYLLHKGLESNRRLLYVSMLAFALSMYCYGISIYTVPFFLLICCVKLLSKKSISVCEALLCLLCYLLPALPFLLTMAVNYFKLPSIELPFLTIPFFPNTARAGDILFFSDSPFEQLLSNLKSFVRVVIMQEDGLAWNYIEGFGTVYSFSLPFALIGMVSSFRPREKNSEMLLRLFLLTGIWNCLITNNVNINRANLIFYALIAIIALGIVYVLEALPWLRPPVAISYALATVLMLSAYFGPYADTVKHRFYSGFGEALTAIESSGAEKLYISSDVQYHGSKKTAEILTLFYNATDSAYFRGEKQSDRLLPYSERYSYQSISSELLEQSSSENAAYLAQSSTLELFDEDEFELEIYGDYIAAVRR